MLKSLVSIQSTVSYTHLDVYKRQAVMSVIIASISFFISSRPPCMNNRVCPDISAAKIEEFEEYLEEADDAGVRDRIQKLRLPRHTSIMKREGYLEQLTWGEMGDYVRQLLNGKQPES